MLVNLELKAKIVSPARTLKALRKMGGPSETLIQTDTYFRIKSGRLKLREFANGKTELIFYRRNEETGRRWSYYSILNISDVKNTKAFLKEAFGIDVVVRKTRHVYCSRGETRIHFDRVKGLGMFIEFEVSQKKDRERRDILLSN